MDFTTASTAGACCLGTADATLRRKCTLQRCQVAPAKTWVRALRKPSWASEMTSWQPLSPRRARLRQNSTQKASVSLAPTASPRTLFSPLSRTYASCTTASRARSMRRRGSSSDGKKLPERSLGICSSRRPDPVSRTRSR